VLKSDICFWFFSAPKINLLLSPLVFLNHQSYGGVWFKCTTTSSAQKNLSVTVGY
jgi:hypothetical protein